MLLCRCEESLLFRNAREVYVYQRRGTRMGSPPLIFQDSFSRRENPSGVTTRLPQSSFFRWPFLCGRAGPKLPGRKEKPPPRGGFCEDRTIEMFLHFHCLDLNTCHNYFTSLRFCFQGCLQRHLKAVYSVISISVPPIKTTLIFSFDSTIMHSMI